VNGRPAEESSVYLIVKKFSHTPIKKLSPLAALVLTNLDAPITLDGLIERLRDLVDTNDVAAETFASVVRDQVTAAFDAGIVVAAGNAVRQPSSLVTEVV
jgi:hypothetical protein